LQINEREIAVDSGSSGDIRVYDFIMNEHKPTNILKGHSDLVNCLLLSEDKKILYSCSADKTIRKWSLEHRTCLDTFIGHTGLVTSIIIYSPNILCSVSKNSILKLWDTDNGNCFFSSNRYFDWILQVTIIKAKMLVTIGDNKIVRFWE